MNYSKQQIIEETRRFFVKVYAWMFLGLLISGLTGMFVASDSLLLEIILSNFFIFIGLLVGELILIFSLLWLIKRISSKLAIFMFLLYCFMSGLTLSVVFLVYTLESITLTFFITAGMFGAMSIYGYFSKKDLTKIGQILIMALFGLIIASLANLYFRNTFTDYVISFVGIIIFLGLTAYDTQKIRRSNIIGNEGTPEDIKESIIGAVHLYLDFVNLFLKLLRLVGKKR